VLVFAKRGGGADGGIDDFTLPAPMELVKS
jgi:hypothetical protein